ncbi:MAG: DUF1284 domain-containing protein [Pseudomonadota bacterium]
MAIRLRPHHVLCSIGFEGQGYNGPFTANMVRIVMGILRAPSGLDERILITGQADAICAPCPHRIGLGCEYNDKINKIDEAHAELLDLPIGLQLTWADALERAKQRVEPDDLDRICDGCRWLDSGMCKKALAHLKGLGSGDETEAA